jgi:hypothetical protein
MDTLTETYDLTAITADRNLYDQTLQAMRDMAVTNYACRSQSVVVSIGGEGRTMRFSDLLVNLILARPFAHLSVPFEAGFILPTEQGFSSGGVAGHIDRIIQRFEGSDYEALNQAISESIEILADLAGKFNIAAGNSISIYSLVKAAQTNGELAELLTLKLPPNLQFDEIEDFIADSTKRLVEILKTEDTPFRPYLRAGTGINVKQLSQAIMMIGLKPDLIGNVIPFPIEANFLTGLRHVRDYYINAEAARKAQIVNNKNVKESGYLTRKLSLLMVDIELDNDLEDCGTQHYLTCRVEDEKVLRRIVGRRFLAGDGSLQLIEHGDDYLIGYELMLRSPVTCCSQRVCRTCYGENLATLNRDVHAGLFAMLYLTHQLTQMLLSSKHLLQTTSQKIDWPEEFLGRFTVDRNMVTPNNTSSDAIVIDQMDITEAEDGAYRSISRFWITSRSKNRTEVYVPIELVLSRETERLLANFKTSDSEITIPLKAYDAEEAAFQIIMENKEISSSLKGILDLIDSSGHLGLDQIDDIFNKFVSLLNESGIRLQGVHAEMVLRALVRDPEDLQKRPDFNQPEYPPYTVLRVAEAIHNSGSVSVSLAFQEIKRQLSSPSTFKKSESSNLDAVFRG